MFILSNAIPVESGWRERWRGEHHSRRWRPKTTKTKRKGNATILKIILSHWGPPMLINECTHGIVRRLGQKRPPNGIYIYIYISNPFHT